MLRQWCPGAGAAVVLVSAVAAPIARAQSAPQDRTEQEFTLGVISRVYDGIAKKVLARPAACLGSAFALLALSLVLLSGIGTALIPQISEGEFYFEVNMPEGTALSKTDDIIQRMEKEARNPDLGIARSYSTSGSRLVSGGMSLNTLGENLGQLNLVMKDRGDDRKEKLTIDKLRTSFIGSIPGLNVKFKRPSYFSLKTPIEIIIFGDQLEVLESRARKMITELRNCRASSM